MFDFNGSNGSLACGSLTLFGNKLFGMTSSGGLYHWGTIFSIDTDGTGFKDIFNFKLYGSNPYGNLTIVGRKLFGMTLGGGSTGGGCIFSIDSGGSGYKDVFDFTLYGTKGYSGYGDLTLSGNKFYGMLDHGGAFNKGVIFSIDTNGTSYKDIHDFKGSTTDGAGPISSVTLAGNKLYGMTSLGGATGNGIVFSMDTNGSQFTDMVDFNILNGYQPIGSLINAGNKLYGMTWGGFVNFAGTIFSIDTNGTIFTDMYNFNGTTGGNPDYGILTLVGNSLYGMASGGGSGDSGVVFKFDTALFLSLKVPSGANELSVRRMTISVLLLI